MSSSHPSTGEAGSPDQQATAPRRKRRSRRNLTGITSAATPLDDFFSQYPPFVFNRTKSAPDEFKRLCSHFRWRKEDRDEVRAQYKDALVKTFNSTFGTDENDLTSWKSLCQDISIYPIPDDLESCRQAVWSSYVNIVDLVDSQRTGVAVCRFPSLGDLVEYTIDTEKYFPKENAYAGGLLRELLREILGTYHGKRRPKGNAPRRQRKPKKKAQS
ncbi:hypothetical protein BV22DRAFT_152681 [Leucogyrophana mollusca]|uniref:Uncharacterized protein n=1 Tax=Leucogyrophana mollusca TaxID=85980 RepID=A0ACB8BUW3_9AGAM|nr:hypothetical protein BV22DRAFT_152681 [Leucogyrophana mollusca]